MCLPELLMDLVIIKGVTVKLSVVSAAPRHSYIVSFQIHVMGCDVMFSCHVIGLLIKDVADIEHNGLNCIAKVRSELHVVAKEEEEEKNIQLSH